MNRLYKEYTYSNTERCITKEPFYINNPGYIKCYVPVLMPFIPEGEPADIEVRPSTAHLLNKMPEDENAEGYYEITHSPKIYTSNYIYEYIPAYITSALRDFHLDIVGDSLFSTFIPTIYRNYFYPEAFWLGIVNPNKEFLLSFVGGDVNNRRIIGRYT